jgi:crotonobetainyl-CoA:carnitine CoA-transferase CaiB-like acyl-CoA transferase
VRARSGITQRVDTDLLSAGAVLSSQWFTRYAGKPERPLADKEQYGLGPFHRLYRAADGWIYAVAESDSARRAMCALFGVAMPHASAPPGQHPNATPFAWQLAAAVEQRSLAQVLAELNAAGVAATEAAAPDSEIFLDHPNTSANRMVAVRQHAKAGTLRVAWQLVQFGDTHPSAGLPTPLLGEHTTQVLREIGCSEAEIASLHAAGIVKTERA